MLNLTYTTYPGLGEWARTVRHYSQAVRVGNIIHISGQGGWDPNKFENITFDPDISRQIDKAFENVQLALVSAGGKGWKQVYKVTSYHVTSSSVIDEEITQAMVRNLKKWMPDHAPIWTEIGVRGLGAEGMEVEIEVEAFDG
ncbi:hypothetical protein I302_108899 [Kwoniella bestiolae CBS 10118]|uniref:Uncharacterized protein n=1 Tax=Kwoniella bestiolae CBS 10118 TaxID=1296100 RepID=A0A1B9FUD6_9TREE|nr:hypothetical protein I302_08037 [Kwoniella bestiolae CBS 10118]OCF22389.1 hypothetical protein I302_08037 [Kwoniella bestiolae CBS 10118]